MDFVREWIRPNSPAPVTPDYLRLMAEDVSIRSTNPPPMECVRVALLRSAHEIERLREHLDKAVVADLDNLVATAAAHHGGPGEMFTTAGFRHAVGERFHYQIGDVMAAKILAGYRRVVRLHGGCHWFLLPSGYSRHEEKA